MSHDEPRILPLQFRAFPDISNRHEKQPRLRRPLSGRHVLLFDDETTTDHAYRLLFGGARLMVEQWDAATLTMKLLPLKTILYYADDLETIRPLTYKALQSIAHQHRIPLISNSMFVRSYLLTCGYSDVLSEDYQPGTVAGFNASFDMWRHVTRVMPARGYYYGGISGEFLNGDAWAPNYREKKAGIGMQREFTLTAARGSSRRWEPPVILDVSQLVRSETGIQHNLLSAGKALGCETLKFEAEEIHDPEEHYSGHDLESQILHYIEYNLNDVAATAELYEKIITRFYRHPIDLRPEVNFSPASDSKQYLRDMGIHAPLCTCKPCRKDKRGAWSIPFEIQGRAMAAFLGARSEAPVRLKSTPGVLYDWKSMYPTIMIRTGIWELLVADRIECREETEQVQTLLNTLTEEDLYRPETWSQLCGIAEIVADGTDWIPCRAQYGAEVNPSGPGGSGIGIQYVAQSGDHPPIPLALPDLVSSKLRTGKAPQILKAWRLYPSNDKQNTLKPIAFTSNDKLFFDPAKQNLLKFLVEQRQRIRNQGNLAQEEMFLKLFVNAIYGVFAEMNRPVRPVDNPIKGKVYGLGGESWEVNNPEQPGEYCHPLFACVITSGARLMLAMLETAVRSEGSTFIFCDTDSGCIPATPDGKQVGEIPVLSYAQAKTYTERFDSLNPYDRNVIPHLVDWQYPKLEDDGTRKPVHVTAISAKRYSMYQLENGKPKILATVDKDDIEESAEDLNVVKRSEHGLGLYLNPHTKDASKDSEAESEDWYKETWEHGVKVHVFGLEDSAPEPDWLDRPAVSRFPVRTLHVLKAFEEFNTDCFMPDDHGTMQRVMKPIHDQVIPFNFYLAVHRPRASLMETAIDPESEKLRLVAPFNRDPASWIDLEWIDLNSGRKYHITTNPDEEIPGQVLLVKSYRDVIWEYFTHPEIKYDDYRGKPCGMFTRGILQPAHIFAEAYQHISKDSSSIATSGDAFEHSGPYKYNDDSRKRLMVASLKLLRRKEIGRRNLEFLTGLSEKTCHNFMMDRVNVVRDDAMDAILKVVVPMARDDLKRGNGIDRWSTRWSDSYRTPGQILTAWLRAMESGSITTHKYRLPRIRSIDILESEIYIVED